MALPPVLLVSSFVLVVLSPTYAVDSKNNPADQLVAVINANRTASKSSELIDNPGLGCIALQYIKAYEGQCSEVGDMKKPPDSSFVDAFAPNCGVRAQSLTPITGRLLGCQSKYMSPDEAFSNILVQNSRSLQILHDKNHTEVGAAVTGTDGGSPYFWCVLFSSGKKNGSFVFENGEAKTVHPGCFSGNNDDCSAAAQFAALGSVVWKIIAGVLCVVVCVL
ncbi:hypothetical protein HPP92_015543 [Vanilla planifolia]|uniref:Ferredoxin-like protein n=1 Tax=Vanilla planifolia TaxID=51239 RepID=A0A835QNK8_VANPL|nr:hypothetical protein HPP92_016192 [Vanilla planifolia]KAG0470997.1 hypothetical protein HPP92_015543 [Vanilla planifolia]